MAEIQKADQNGAAVGERFIEFVMLQAQQAMLCLGQLPHPGTGEQTVNIEAARMFIDYLELLREKTRGNLTKEEEGILSSILAQLQMSFIKVQEKVQEERSHSPIVTPKETSSSEVLSGEEKQEMPPKEQEEEKKRFSKSYGS